jgi:hypothetical protein
MSEFDDLQTAWDTYKANKSPENKTALETAKAAARAEIDRLEEDQKDASLSDQQGLDDSIQELRDLLDTTEESGGRRRRRRGRKTRRGGRRHRKSRKSRKSRK